jgi:hypothetical protein
MIGIGRPIHFDLISDLIGGLLDFILGPIQALIGWVVKSITDFLMMVLGGIFDLLLGLVGFLISLLPDVPDLHLSAPSGILVGYGWLNSFLPVAETLTAVGVLVGVMVVIFGYRIIIKIYELFPFKFT